VLSQSVADRGQSIRGIPVLGDFTELDRVVGEMAQQGTISNYRVRGVTRLGVSADAKPGRT